MTQKLAIFDVDGTLVDSRQIITQAMAEAFENEGLPPPDYHKTRQIVGLSIYEAIDRIAPRDIDSDSLERLVEGYKTAFVARRRAGAVAEPLYNGIYDLLHALKDAGWKLGMATGKSRKGVEAFLKKYDFAPLFDTSFCADDGPGKPNAFMVLANLEALSIPAQRALMIGDTTFDMLMAKAAGVRDIGVNWGFHTEGELQSVDTSFIASSVQALSDIIFNFKPVSCL